jgi:hypothetical protein
MEYSDAKIVYQLMCSINSVSGRKSGYFGLTVSMATFQIQAVTYL